MAKKKKDEEKPVGEILKEQGVVAPEEVKTPIEEDTFEESTNDINKVLMKVEKLGAIVNTIRELDADREKRINELAENIGEIRSLLFQRDATIREMESRIGKLEESVKNIEPEKIEKIMEKREKEIEKINATLEKNDVILKDLSKRIRRAEKILDNIKSIENLAEIVKEIEEAVEEVRDIKSSTKRDAAKAERFYLEMGKRLDEFDKMKEDISKLDEMTKELMRSVDENRIQLDSKVSKEDLKKAIEEVTKIPEMGKEEKIKELENRKAEIETLLKRLEMQRKENLISESAYNEIFEKNKVLLDEINKEILDLNTKEQPTDLKSWLNEIDESIKKLNEKIDIEDVKEKSIEEKVRDLYSKLNEINDSIVEIKEKIEMLKKTKPPEEEVKILPKGENLLNKKKDIMELLENLEEEYRKGSISEKTYEEIKSKNLKKLEEIERQLQGEVKKVEKIPEKKKSEFEELEEKINLLSGEKREELKSLLMLAKEKMARGYPLLSKRYLDQIKEKLGEV
ncbi:MAG: hypothetical protein J7L45_02255 [Candidatus Aenigmarchaeota archaeon]|nr:hypothetical protein [Candidatus Aenigmarchaeota archaeon]